MNLEEIKINTIEILRYLGYGGQILDEQIKDDIKTIKQLVKNYIHLRYVIKRYKIVRVEEGILLKGTNFILMGKDIEKHLKLCDECFLIAITLGNDFEKLFRLYEKKSLSQSIIIDCCGTTAIEEVCDSLEEEIKKDSDHDKERKSGRDLLCVNGNAEEGVAVLLYGFYRDCDK